MKPNFPYKTILDRVITNAKGEIIFEKDKPAYVIDESTIKELQDLIAKQQETIDELKVQTSNQESQLANQQLTIDELESQSGNQLRQITNQDLTIDELEKQTLNQTEIITELQTQKTVLDSIVTNQESTISKLDEKFQDKLYGLSTDEKPLEDINIGTLFYEVDTEIEFIFDGTEWLEVGGTVE